jgi:hypothetical protein
MFKYAYSLKIPHTFRIPTVFIDMSTYTLVALVLVPKLAPFLMSQHSVEAIK